MILALIVLWSLCSVYITYLLHKNKLKVAEIAYTVLHSYVLLWAILIFIVDAVNFGFTAASTSTDLILGGDMAAAFEYFAEAIYEMPVTIAGAVEVVALLVLSTVILVLAISGVRAAAQIYRWLKSGRAGVKNSHTVEKTLPASPAVYYVNRRKLCCRANC